MNSGNFQSEYFDPDAMDREYERRQSGYRNTREESAGTSQKAETKDKKKSKANVFVRFFTDRRTKMFAGIASMCWATYMLISAISYFTTSGEDDQSLVLNRTVSEMAAQPEEVSNAGGALGAFISQSIFSNGLGIGAFVLIYYFFALGWCILNRKKFGFWSLTMKSLVVAITLSLVTGLVTYNSHSWVYWGGIHGHEVNTWLLNTTGVIGAILVSALLVGLVIAIYLNELRLLYVNYRRRVNAFNAKVAAERARKEEERRRVQETLDNSDNTMGNVTQEENEPEYEPVQRQTTTPLATSTVFDTSYADEPPYREKEVRPEPQPVSEPITRAVTVPSYTEPVSSYPSEPMTEENEMASTVSEYGIAENDIDSTPEEEDIEPADTTGEVGLTITENTIEEADKIAEKPYDPTAELSRFRFPSIELLEDIQIKENSVDEQEMEENKERIQSTLANYQIPISHIEATVGPTVTLYEIIPAEGVRISKIKNLEDDIALSLAALGIRIIAPIPGKGTIGIEVPNKEPQMVPIRSIISSKKFQECKYELPMAMGATISKDVFIADLTKMPHVLVAGATGQGKSVGLNTIIASLLYKKHPAELKFVLIDPKMVEFSIYSRLEHHYIAKLPDEQEAIITDPMKVVATLSSLCVEMDNRYALLKDANVRNIKEYNAKFVQRRLNPEKGHRYLPYIVIVVDEFGDLIMMAGKEVETPIARIAQKARAVGMHMILATQRPSTNVITGIIKANFPGRIAFRVAQMVDSRTILDRPGANQLIGKGDMLFSHNGEMDRVQCAFISTEEVEAICDSIEEQYGYPEAYPLPEVEAEGDLAGNLGSVNDRDPLFAEAADFIITSNTASTSSLQRRFSIGYNRAGKIMDQLEAAGIVSAASGSKPRQVLVDSIQLNRILQGDA